MYRLINVKSTTIYCMHNIIFAVQAISPCISIAAYLQSYLFEQAVLNLLKSLRFYKTPYLLLDSLLID
ncbi:hypothetical protein KsCSTR_27550 [Candidatus Kuenenia stuttgartiensis]|uniref:Uncharacterized protein n=1 Tax=Kuenenia stuttgartiensis TaxID=174633 RepID=Q1Q0N3_KUEST|nr:hypothetical protein KsCSTR_27550 [Candidatus Kuenenia stuttgartiensis]CAJ73552.1 unknown protein [Candidatus Kuenenia stuttgartiensis]